MGNVAKSSEVSASSKFNKKSSNKKKVKKSYVEQTRYNNIDILVITETKKKKPGM